MAVSVDAKAKELMKNEAAAGILEKFAPGFKTNPQMKLVGGLTFRKLASFPQAGLSPEQVEEIDAALFLASDESKFVNGIVLTCDGSRAVLRLERTRALFFGAPC